MASLISDALELVVCVCFSCACVRASNFQHRHLSPPSLCSIAAIVRSIRLKCRTRFLRLTASVRAIIATNFTCPSERAVGKHKHKRKLIN